MSGCGPCGPTVAGQPSGGGGMGPPGPPGPPGPSGGCANTVLVEAADPFATLPAPVGSVVALLPNTLYKFCGSVDIGANTLDLPNTSVAAGDDPAIDTVRGSNGITVRATNGGTIKDISVIQTAGLGIGLLIGGPGATWQDCVIWNLSTASIGGEGVQILGSGAFLSIARILDRGSSTAIRIGAAEAATTIAAANVDNQVYVPPRGVPGTGVELDASASIQQLALTESALSIADPAGFGYNLRGQVGTLRVASCAFAGSGTPSVVAQPGGLPPATVGSAIQGESVGCVGFDNSLQRGSIQIQNALTPIPGPGVPVPVGTPAASYVLDPSSIRVSLDGPNAPAQSIRFDRLAPYSAEITVSLSVQVAIGLTFTPRIIVAGIEINGVPTALQFAGTTPDFTSQAPVSISFTTPATLQGGDLVRLLISNQTDAANLEVVAARITIT